MNFFDYITESLNDLESDQYRNIRWTPTFLWECVHLAMIELRTDLVDVFMKDQEINLARGTCYQKGVCSTDSDGNSIDGVLVKILMIDGQSCQRPTLSSEKEEGIASVLKQFGGYWGFGSCAQDSCVGTEPPLCLDEDGNEAFDWGGINLDIGTNNFWLLNPTPTDRDITAMVRCSIIPSTNDIETWLNEPENFGEFERVKHMLYELVLYYAYERDDETQERDKMMKMRWTHYKEKIKLYNAKYTKTEFLYS